MPTVPSELIMTFGGALAAGAVPGTSLDRVAVIAAGVAGNVVGSYLAWAAGNTAASPRCNGGATGSGYASTTWTGPTFGSPGMAQGPS